MGFGGETKASTTGIIDLQVKEPRISMISSASSSGAASSQASKSAHPGIREHTLFFGQLDSRATE